MGAGKDKQKGTKMAPVGSAWEHCNTAARPIHMHKVLLGNQSVIP